MLHAPLAHAAHHRLSFLVPAAFELLIQAWHGRLPTATPRRPSAGTLLYRIYPKIYRSPHAACRATEELRLILCAQPVSQVLTGVPVRGIRIRTLVHGKVG